MTKPESSSIWFKLIWALFALPRTKWDIHLFKNTTFIYTEILFGRRIPGNTMPGAETGHAAPAKLKNLSPGAMKG